MREYLVEIESKCKEKEDIKIKEGEIIGSAWSFEIVFAEIALSLIVEIGPFIA